MSCLIQALSDFNQCISATLSMLPALIDRLDPRVFKLNNWCVRIFELLRLTLDERRMKKSSNCSISPPAKSHGPSQMNATSNLNTNVTLFQGAQETEKKAPRLHDVHAKCRVDPSTSIWNNCEGSADKCYAMQVSNWIRLNELQSV